MLADCVQSGRVHGDVESLVLDTSITGVWDVECAAHGHAYSGQDTELTGSGHVVLCREPPFRECLPVRSSCRGSVVSGLNFAVEPLRQSVAVCEPSLCREPSALTYHLLGENMLYLA